MVKQQHGKERDPVISAVVVLSIMNGTELVNINTLGYRDSWASLISYVSEFYLAAKESLRWISLIPEGS